MKLIYRALILESAPRPVAPYRKPPALHWRFHAPNEVYGETQKSSSLYRYPRALNWRFRMAAGV
jgi:hypothetical protein